MEKKSFLQLYEYACGKCETPRLFNVWSCLSLLAACVGDRVKLEWIKGQPILPNIYVFLIAPSGIGKNVAATTAIQYVENPEWVGQKVNLWRGKLTAPFLHDKLGQKVYDEEKGEYVQPNSKIWFVTPELAQGVGEGVMAAQLIKTMTEFFSAGGTVLSEGTRTKGELTVKEPCLNWLAGSTKEWLIDAVKPEGIKSGFFARCIPVHYQRLTPEVRVWRPQYPADCDRVVAYLRARVQALLYLSGRFDMTPEAEAWGQAWYMNRPDEKDEYKAAYWNRTREMMFKLAMLLVVSDGGALVIDVKHLQRAKRMYQELQRDAMVLVELALQTPQTKPTATVAVMLQKAKRMGKWELTAAAHKLGISTKECTDAVCALQGWGAIKVEMGREGKQGRPKTWYVWTDGKEG